MANLQIVWNDHGVLTEHSLSTHGVFTAGIRNKEGNKEMEKEGNIENKFSSNPSELDHSLFTEKKEEKEKSSAKKEKEDLVFPFSSEEFKTKWKVFMEMPKQKKKPSVSKQMMLNNLSEFDEPFAIKQIELAIQNNWQGLTFSDTKEKYLQTKKALLTHGAKQQTNDQKRDELNAFAALAGQVVYSIDGQNH